MADEKKNKAEEQQSYIELQEKNKELKRVKAQFTDSQKQLDEIKAEEQQRKAQLLALTDFKEKTMNGLTCESCGFVASNHFGLAAHKRSCKEKVLEASIELSEKI